MPSDALFFACELLHVSTERYEVLDSGVTIKSFQNRSQNAENEQKGPLFPFAPGVPGAVKAILQNSVRTEKSVGTMEGALCSLKQRGPLSGCSLLAPPLQLNGCSPALFGAQIRLVSFNPRHRQAHPAGKSSGLMVPV